MSTSAGTRPVVVSSTSSDSHMWNLVYLQLLIEECGHDVVNLGACVPDDDLVAGSVAADPCLIVVSSVNGHGFSDGLRAITPLRAHPALATVPVVIGGKLGTDGLRNISQRSQLLAAGFDHVFDDGDISAFTRLLAGLSRVVAVS